MSLRRCGEIFHRLLLLIIWYSVVGGDRQSVSGGFQGGWEPLVRPLTQKPANLAGLLRVCAKDTSDSTVVLLGEISL